MRRKYGYENSKCKGKFLKKSLYSLSIAISASLLSLLVLIFICPLFETGEGLVALGLTWWISTPAIILISILCLITFSSYCNAKSWTKRITIYGGCVLTTIILGFLLTWYLLNCGIL